MRKLTLRKKKALQITSANEMDHNLLSKRTISKNHGKTEEASLHESTNQVVELLKFRSLERASSPLILRSEAKNERRDKYTRPWIWANLDWEGSLTIETSSTSSSESWESEEYYEYIPPIEEDEDPTDEEKNEMIKKWLFKSELDLNKRKVNEMPGLNRT